jgi:RNA polymerase sigma-70 factor (ECF subfamily)
LFEVTSNPLILRLQKLSDTFSEEARTETDTAGDRSDAELMCLIQRRDHEAFAELFDRYHGTVRAIVRNILKSSEDVDDVVQEAFLDVYQNSGAYDPSRGTVRVWISFLARYRSIRKWHHLRRRNWQAEDADKAKPIADPGCTPDQRIRSIDFERFLDVVLDALSDRQRRTVVLYFFEGLDLESIASHLGDSLSNTRHHLYRGLARLRRELVTTQSLAGYGEFETCSSKVKTGL